MKTIYIRLSARQIAKSTELQAPDGATVIVVDADKSGAVVGIEILGTFAIAKPRKRKGGAS